MHHCFVYTKEISKKNTKENSVRSLPYKNEYIYLLVNAYLIGQHSWSPDELNDTHLARIACHIKLHAHAIWQEIACTCNFLCMQLPQDGCRPTRMNFRNAVLWDGHSQPDKYAHFCTILIRVNFPLNYLKFPLYIQNSGALQEKCIYNPNSFFVGFIWSIHSYICIAIYKKRKFIFLEHPISIPGLIRLRLPMPTPNFEC